MGCLSFNRNKSIRLGAILAPQLALVLPNLTPGLPTLHLYIFSIVSLLGSILAILIPETANSSLPENFDQVLFKWKECIGIANFIVRYLIYGRIRKNSGAL